MIKQMGVGTRRPDMTHEEYVDYVKHIHGYQITCTNPLTLSNLYKIMYSMLHMVLKVMY